MNEAAMRRRIVVASTVGNALEWFDFIVFGLFAVQIGRAFFPVSDPANALLASFATFGAAFAARPLGGLFFGLYADRYGRKRALVGMIGLMALGSGMIGLLPTYASIGVFAPALLLLARLVQGFSAGGEFGAASALLIEFAPPGQRGRYGAWQMAAQALAFAAAAGFALGLHLALSPQELTEWGWRIPFLFGVLVGPVGVYLRRKCDESPEFLALAAQAPDRRALAPLSDLWPRRRALAASFGVIAAGAALNYVGLVFVPAFAVAELGLRPAAAQTGVLVVSLVSAALAVPFGALSDRFGRRAVIAPALIAFSLLYYVAMTRLVAAPGEGALWLAQASGLLFAAFAGPVPALMTETLPPGARATGASLAFNIGGLLFGGLAPVFNAALAQATGDRGASVYYIFFVVGLGLIGLALWRPEPAAARAPV